MCRTRKHNLCVYRFQPVYITLYFANMWYLSDFKKALDTQANNSCSAVEEEMVKMYQLQSKVIEAKFDELFSVLDRISTINFKHSASAS